jgi:hypothetical protein
MPQLTLADGSPPHGRLCHRPLCRHPPRFFELHSEDDDEEDEPPEKTDPLRATAKAGGLLPLIPSNSKAVSHQKTCHRKTIKKPVVRPGVFH